MNDSKLICLSCGQPLEPDDVFCGACGRRVPSKRNENLQPKPSEKSAQTKESGHIPSPVPELVAEAAVDKSKPKNKKLWFTAAILSGLLILVIIVSLINESTETETGQQGSSLDNRALSQIKIADIQTFYELNASVGKIFVLTGKVINQGPLPIRFIRLEASLYSPDGAFLTRQMTYAGNMIDRGQLKSWPIHSIEVVMHTPHGHNPGETLQSGGKLPFVIVFANLPASASPRYEVRVMNADPG